MRGLLSPVTGLVLLLLAAINGYADATFDKLLAEGKFKDAITYADNNIPAPSRTAKDWVQLGAANDAIGMPEKALACFMVSWRINPKDYESLLGAARIYNKLNQTENAMKYAKLALDEQFTADASWEYAKACIALKRPAEAKLALEKVIQADAGNIVANRELGGIYFDDKEFDKAIPLLQKALAAKDDAELAFRIGQSYNQTGDTKSALQYIEKALASGLKRPEVVVDLARAYFGQQEFAKAASKYDDAIKLSAQLEAEDFYNLALAREAIKNTFAIQAFLQAVQSFGNAVSDNALKARLKVAGAAISAKRYDDALTQLNFIVAAPNGLTIAPDGYFLLADAHFAKGDKVNAIASLEKALARDKNNYEASARLADLYEKSGQKDKAQSTYEAMLALNPNDPAVYLTLGAYNLKSQKYTEALDLFSKAVALKSSADAQEGVAQAAAALNQWNRARTAALEVVQQDATRMVSRKILAQVYLRSKEYAEAKDQLEVLASREPREIRHWEELAQCYGNLGDERSLARVDAKIVELDAKNVEAYLRLARYEQKTGAADAAFAHYKRASELNSKNDEAFKYMYKAALQKQQNAEALVFLRSYLALKPNDAEAQKDMGDISYARNELDAALAAYRAVIKLDPSMRGFYKQYAEVVIKKGLESEVIKALSTLIDAGDADMNAYTTLGMIYDKQKNYRLALDIYQKALQIEPQNASVLSAYAASQAATGDVAGALITYEQTVMMDPKAVDEYRALGSLYEQQNKLDEAMKAYGEYLDRKPGDQSVAQKVGTYFHGKKMYDRAARYLGSVQGQAATEFYHQQRLAESFYYIQNYEAAIPLLVQLRKRGPKIVSLRELTVMLADCYEKMGKNVLAAAVYGELAGMGAKDAEAAYKSAVLQEKANPVVALKIYEQNVVAYPQDYRNYIRLGMMYAAEKATLAKSIPMLKKATVLADTIADVWLELATVYGQLNKSDDELKAYQEYAKAVPQSFVANKRIGLLLVKQNKYTEGMVYLETANTVKPGDAEVIIALAQGYRKTNRNDEAISYLQKAKQLDGKNLEVRQGLFDLYAQKGMVKEAQQTMNELLQVERKPAYLARYAEFLYKNQQIKEAESIVEDVLAVEPENIPVLLIKAAVLRAQKRMDEAVEVYKEIGYIEPNNVFALYERAETHRVMAKPQWARTFYERALRANPNFAPAELGLALLAKVAKSKDEYMQHLKRAYELDPRNPEIAEEWKRSSK